MQQNLGSGEKYKRWVRGCIYPGNCCALSQSQLLLVSPTVVFIIRVSSRLARREREATSNSALQSIVIA